MQREAICDIKQKIEKKGRTKSEKKGLGDFLF